MNYILLAMTLILHFIMIITRGLAEPWVTAKIIAPILGLVSLSIYLFSLFQKKTIISPFKELFTYFLLGFFLFFVSSPIILFSRITFGEDNPLLGPWLQQIHGIVVILMYLIFSFGFIWSKKKS